MPKILSGDQVAAYGENGFLFPFDVYGPFPWLCDVVRAPRLLDAVEDLIGPDVLCWGASFFAKKAHDPRYVSWHTDSFFYGFEPADTLTAWLAFNPSTEQSGCVKYIPGSHKFATVHDIMPDADNLLPMAQNAKDVPEEKAVSAVLAPGQVVFHHESVVHGSGPNTADHPRVGLSIHYVAPHVRETRFEGSSAMLLRGEDTCGNWGIDPEPTEDFDPACIQAMHDTRALYLNATANKIDAGGRS